MTVNDLVINFFEVYLAAPIILISYVGYKLWFKTRFVRTPDIDISTGIRETEEYLAALKESDRAMQRGRVWWKRIYYVFC